MRGGACCRAILAIGAVRRFCAHHTNQPLPTEPIRSTRRALPCSAPASLLRYAPLYISAVKSPATDSSSHFAVQALKLQAPKSVCSTVTVTEL